MVAKSSIKIYGRDVVLDYNPVGKQWVAVFTVKELKNFVRGIRKAVRGSK